MNRVDYDAEGSRDAPPSPRGPVTKWSRNSPWVIIWGVGALSLGISLWQLSVPEVLSLYNSGVYFGAAVRFVSGAWPYRAFTFVQPPGIVVLLSPIALLARVVGTHDGFIVARVVDSIATAANASLLARLVRHRGRIAMLIAGGGLALIPVSAWVSSAVMLEPFCLMFALAGAVVVFSNSRASGPATRSLLWGGVLFGLAAEVKLWAFFPFVAAVAVLAVPLGRRVWFFVAAAGGAFALSALPFFIAAPRAFLSEVLVEQIARHGNFLNSPGFGARLVNLSGFATTLEHPTALEAIVAFAILTVVVAVAMWRRAGAHPVDSFVVVATALVVGALLTAPEFYSYYAYFSAPFLLATVAISLARLAPVLWRPTWGSHVTARIRKLVAVTAPLGGAIFLVAAILWVTTAYSVYAWAYGEYEPWIGALARYVPAGSCVVYSDVSFGILTNRMTSTNPHCPTVVDPDGMWMAWGYQRVPAAAPFVAQWRSYFAAAQYVVLLYPRVSRIPWNHGLNHWFTLHYHRLYGRHYVYVYANDANPSPS